MSEEQEDTEQNIKETPPDYDPLLQQAEALPAFLKGTDGNASHVRDVTDGDGDEEPIDDGFGYVPPDPSTFTAD